MKKLSKKQRHEIFVEAFKKIESGRHTFMCNAIEEVLRQRNDFTMFNFFDEISKEASLMCPENYREGYYSCVTTDIYNDGVCIGGLEATNLRLMILQFCIELTK